MRIENGGVAVLDESGQARGAAIETASPMVNMNGLNIIDNMSIARRLEEKNRACLDSPCTETREQLAEALDVELRRLSRAEAMLDILQGKLLAEIKRKGGEKLGYPRIANYAREELGISERFAQELLRVERILPRYPLFRKAYENGELTRSKVSLLLRYLEPEDESIWLEHAKRNRHPADDN